MTYFVADFEIRILFINTLKIKIMSEIEAKVKDIIVDKLGVDEADVKPEASFTNDLGADSLDTVEALSWSLRRCLVSLSPTIRLRRSPLLVTLSLTSRRTANKAHPSV